MHFQLFENARFVLDSSVTFGQTVIYIYDDNEDDGDDDDDDDECSLYQQCVDTRFTHS